MDKVQKANDGWREDLTAEQYAILREKGTEAPFSGALLHNKDSGMYQCGACGQSLFESGTKFDSGSGWPSFYDALPNSVKLERDSSHGMERVEALCGNCGGHLGHVFDDVPDQPTGQRYCINSLSLTFKPQE